MPEAQAASSDRIQELRVSGNLMKLDPGLYCILFKSAGRGAGGLPGVRVTLAPGEEADGRVAIASFRDDGWISGRDDGVMVRVSQPCRVLVTVYQGPEGSAPAPDLQVLRLTDGTASAGQPTMPRAPAAAEAPAAALRPAGPQEVTAHVQRAGDLATAIGDWIGERGSQRWIEGFAVAPTQGIAAEDIEYQAVLGRGWLSPWAEGGQFCGSRGMALPILGLRVRLRGAAAERYRCTVHASFTDGSAVGPVADGELCEAASLAPLEAFQLSITDRRSGAPLHQPAVAPASPPAELPGPLAAGAAVPAEEPAGASARGRKRATAIIPAPPAASAKRATSQPAPSRPAAKPQASTAKRKPAPPPPRRGR